MQNPSSLKRFTTFFFVTRALGRNVLQFELQIAIWITDWERDGATGEIRSSATQRMRWRHNVIERFWHLLLRVIRGQDGGSDHIKPTAGQQDGRADAGDELSHDGTNDGILYQKWWNSVSKMMTFAGLLLRFSVLHLPNYAFPLPARYLWLLERFLRAVLLFEVSPTELWAQLQLILH